MAKVTRYLKLKHPENGKIFSIKLGTVRIIDPVNEKYTILSYGDNLTEFVFNNKNIKFQIVGTNNTISFNVTGDGTYDSKYTFSASFRGYQKNGIFSSGGGVFWSNSDLYPSLAYEPYYGLLFGITWYQIFKIDSTNKLIAFDNIEAPYTPPDNNIITSVGSWKIYQIGKYGVTGSNEFQKIC